MEHIINNQHIISEKEKAEERFGILGIVNVDFEKIEEFVNSEINTIFYFDSFMNPRMINDKDVSFAWMDSGYRYQGETLFISLKKIDDIYCGYFVGTAKYLVSGMCERNPYKRNEYKNNLNRFLKKYPERIAKRTQLHIESSVIEETETEDKVKSEMRKILESCGYEISEDTTNTKDKTDEEFVYQKELTNVTEEIFEHLLFPSWKSINGLDRYIKIIGKRVEQLVKKGASEYYVKNNLGSVIVNSGLMNLFGKDYLIHYRVHEKYKTYVAYQIISSKKEYLDNGFTKEQASQELKPIQFFEKGEEMFLPTMDDFDLNQQSLMHIIEERRTRFPENLQNVEANKIASHLSEALERGIKMQMRDHSYAKANYSGKEGNISWMMPLHINANLTEEPELVMVIRKKGEFYEVKTILPFDDEVKDRITALSLYSKLW